jgi:hypothetical protein
MYMVSLGKGLQAIERATLKRPKKSRKSGLQEEEEYTWEPSYTVVAGEES